MTFSKFRKIKGLLLLELENSAQFPILEFYLAFLSVMFLGLIYVHTNYEPISSLNSVPTMTTLFIQYLQYSISFYLFFNGLFLGILLNYSLINDRETLFLPTLLSYPVPRKLYLITKFIFYWLINFLIIFSLLLITLVNNSIGFNLTLFIVILSILLVNEFFSIFLVLFYYIISKNFLINNILIFFTWFFLFFLGIPIKVPFFLKIFIQPDTILDLYLVNNVFEIIIGFLFSLFVFSISFLYVVNAFNHRELF